MKHNIFILLVTIPFFLQIGCAKIIYVSQTATGDGKGYDWENAYTSISQALEEAVKESKEEIWVAAGHYRETIQMKQQTKIYGGFEGFETLRTERNWQENITIIDGTGLDAPAVSAIDIDNDLSDGYPALLDGFTIQGAQQSGIYCSNGSPDILHCIITNNSAEEGGGIHCDRSSPTIAFCVINNNQAEKGAGIFCRESSPRITKCVIAKNSAASGGALYLQDQSFPGLINCTLADNEGNGIACWSGSFARLINCIAWNAGLPFAGDNTEASKVEYTCIQGGAIGLGNISGDPLFVEAELGDYHLQTNSPCIDAGLPNAAWNDASLPPGMGTLRCDMGAYGGPDIQELPILLSTPGVRYVRADAEPGGDGTSWETAHHSIREALKQQEYGEIWVAAGHYIESVTMKTDVAIYGGFAGNEKSLSERDWTANETIIDASGLKASAVAGADGAILDGFTVIGGKQARISCIETSPTILHCTITNYANFEEPLDEVCSGVICDRSSPTFIGCNIVGNRVYHDGGGVECLGLGSPQFINCRIENNTATRGGGVYCNIADTPVFTNCIIASNTVTDPGNQNGGGVIIMLDPPILTNCVIANNQGNGIFTFDKVTIQNCIICNNSMKDLAGTELDQDAFVSYSCIAGGFPGEGNIDADPMFVDPDNGDYRLLNGSPCIDCGQIAAAPKEDMEGRNRLGGDSRVDMGAYESPPEFSGTVGVNDWMIHP